MYIMSFVGFGAASSVLGKIDTGAAYTIGIGADYCLGMSLDSHKRKHKEFCSPPAHRAR